MPTSTAALRAIGLPATASHAHVLFILDRSGSMAGSEADVIGGFNTFIDTLRGEAGLPPANVSVTRFDTEVETFWRELSLADVPRMSGADFIPRGSTALLDAVGETLASVETDPADHYLCVIHTDGHENASREWTKEKVRELIQRLQALGNWSFAFFGADTDAWDAAQQYGLAANSVAPMRKSEYSANYRAEARVMARMGRTGRRSSQSMAKAVRALMDNPDIDEGDIDEILDEA